MTWRRDGSGLEVKRIRGMTLPQWEHLLSLSDRGLSARYARRHMFGRCSDVDTMRLHIQRDRKRGRLRRAKRQAKAAEKRVRLALQRFLDAVRLMGVDLGPKGLEVLTAAALDVGLCARRTEAWRMPRADHA